MKIRTFMGIFKDFVLIEDGPADFKEIHILYLINDFLNIIRLSFEFCYCGYSH